MSTVTTTVRPGADAAATTTSPTSIPTPSITAPAAIPVDPVRADASPGRRWAFCGIAAGILGLAQFAITGGLNVDTDLLADNQLVAEALTDRAPYVWAFQVITVAAAALIAVFAAGVFRKLSQQGPAQSLAPMIAVGGLLLVSAMQLVGSGICTEMFFGLIQDTAELDPDTLAAQLAIFNTISWVWAGAGLAAGAVAVVGLRHGAVGRGLAITSAVLAGLVALVNVVPLQYMALIPGALWMICAGVSFARTGQ